MKKIIFLLGLVMLLAVPIAAHGQANPAETKVFDSTDNYIGACSLTATSTWTLSQDLNVSTFQMWYRWQAGETELPITVTKDGAPFASFTATRSACDPYQTSWCNADYAINKSFPAGTYSTAITNAYQCLKPGSTGTVRLYSLGTAAANTNSDPSLVATAEMNINAVVNTNTTVANNANTNIAVDTNIANINTNAASDIEDENESSGTLTYVLIGIIIILVVVIVVMYMQCCKKSADQ
ncbi:MAG: hypothetical protein V1668_04825 [Patescibacteria group bacterium]